LQDAFDVPGKPGTPDVSDLTSESAVLEWKAPDSDGGSPITNYVVEMKTSGDTKWKVVSGKDKITSLTYTVKGIKTDKDVEFRIIAENKAGPGPPSTPSKPAKHGKIWKFIIILFLKLRYSFLRYNFSYSFLRYCFDWIILVVIYISSNR